MRRFGIAGRVDGSGRTVSGLQLSPGLASVPVLDPAGQRIAKVHGLVLTDCLGPGLGFAGAALRLNDSVETPEAFVRHVLRGLAGTFVVETHGGPLGHRIYPSCGGTLPIVYCPESRRFGASADWILGDAGYAARLDRDRVERLVRREGQSGWIPGTLTAHRGVVRLLPNHALDLETFRQHRFWPDPMLFAGPPVPLEDAAAEVASHMRAFAVAVAARFRTAVALTAGVDSRIVLAALRPVRDRIRCFTFSTSGWVDRTIPPRMCRAIGVPHRLLRAVVATPAAQARWDRLVGEVVRTANRDIHPTLERVDCEAILSGVYGEPARADFVKLEWKGLEKRTVDAGRLDGRLRKSTAVGNRRDRMVPFLRRLERFRPSVVRRYVRDRLPIARARAGRTRRKDRSSPP